MSQPTHSIGPFSRITVLHRASMVELCTGFDRSGRPVTIVALSPEAGADPHWCAEFADLVSKDGTVLGPMDSTIHETDLYGTRPWAASYPEPGRRGAERLLAHLPGAIPEGTDPSSLLPSSGILDALNAGRPAADRRPVRRPARGTARTRASRSSTRRRTRGRRPARRPRAGRRATGRSPLLPSRAVTPAGTALAVPAADGLSGRARLGAAVVPAARRVTNSRRGIRSPPRSRSRRRTSSRRPIRRRTRPPRHRRRSRAAGAGWSWRSSPAYWWSPSWPSSAESASTRRSATRTRSPPQGPPGRAARPPRPAHSPRPNAVTLSYGRARPIKPSRR